MLRPTSEIAVAISVASVREKPRRSASARPSARAGTMSPSDATEMQISSGIVVSVVGPAVEEGKSFLEVESRVERLEIELELHHRDGDVRTDPDDHRLRSSQLCGQCDRLQRAGAVPTRSVRSSRSSSTSVSLSADWIEAIK